MDCLWQIFPNTDINNNHLHQQRGCLSVAAVATCTGPRGIAASNWQLDGFWKPSTNDDVRNKCNCIYKHIKGDGDCYYQLNGLTTLEKQQPRIKEYSKDFKLTQMGIWPTGSTLFPKGNMRRNLEQECISFFFYNIHAFMPTYSFCERKQHKTTISGMLHESTYQFLGYEDQTIAASREKNHRSLAVSTSSTVSWTFPSTVQPATAQAVQICSTWRSLLCSANIRFVFRADPLICSVSLCHYTHYL
jgi:hypothetical protein